MSLISKSRVLCDLCDQSFTLQKNLNAHLRKVHRAYGKHVVAYEYEAYLHKCLEGCNVSFFTASDLRIHLHTNHDTQIVVQSAELTSLQEFNAWLQFISQKTGSQYIKQCRKPCGNSIVSYYNCHRTGTTKENHPNPAKRPKNKLRPSVKLNRSCTSQIVLTEKDNKFSIKFYKKHYGHEMDVTTELKHKPKITENKNPVTVSNYSVEVVTTEEDSVECGQEEQTKQEPLLENNVEENMVEYFEVSEDPSAPEIISTNHLLQSVQENLFKIECLCQSLATQNDSISLAAINESLNKTLLDIQGISSLQVME